jgi:hypothetical protein
VISRIGADIVATSPSIRLFAALFAPSLLLSAALAYYASRTMTFAFPIAPAAMATLVMRIQIIRGVGLGFAVILMMLVVLAAARGARGALAMRWLLGVVTSVAFLRGAGLIHPLAQQDGLAIAASALQLGLEAVAILLLYGEDATDWFEMRRFPVRSAVFDAGARRSG